MLLLAVSLIICVADFVSCMKQNVSIDLQVLKFLVCLYNKIVGLDLSPFSEMVENHCWRSKKNANYHNILLSSRNDQTGFVVV